MSEKFEVPEQIIALAQMLSAMDAEEKELKPEELRSDVLADRLHTEWHDAGIQSAEEVFAWAAALSKTEEANVFLGISHTPTAYGNILFFGDAEPDTEWFGLGIEPRGLYVEYSGRWEFAKPRIILRSPDELARFVHPAVLVLAVQHVRSGEAWRSIERGFAYLFGKEAEANREEVARRSLRRTQTKWLN